MATSKKMGYRIFVFLFIAGLFTVVQAAQAKAIKITRQKTEAIKITPQKTEEKVKQTEAKKAEPKKAEEKKVTKKPDIDFDDLDLDLDDDEFMEEDEGEKEFKAFDPLEKVNRKIYVFNDKLYIHVMRPVTNGYRKAVHKKVRRGVSNFFSNLGSPVRFLNNTLQGKPKGSGRELGRFAINSTLGIFGVFDPAKKVFRLEKTNEDFAQTLGHWGVGPGPYIMWPVFGPGTTRGFAGNFVDGFFMPSYYTFPHNPEWKTVVNGFSQVNAMSFRVDQIDSVKKDAIDPYLFVRDAYLQLRAEQVAK